MMPVELDRYARAVRRRLARWVRAAPSPFAQAVRTRGSDPCRQPDVTVEDLKTAEMTGNLDDAMRLADHLLATSRSVEYASFTRVRLLIKLNRLSEAREALGATAERFPGNVHTNLLAARLAEASGDLSEALAQLETAAAAHPQHEATNRALVQVLLKMGRVDSARARACGPAQDAGGQVALARGLHELGQSVAALDVLDDVLGVDPHHVDAALWRIRILLRYSRLSEAAQAVGQLGSDDVDVLILSARVHERLGDFSKARAAWRAVLAARPAHREATLSLDALDCKERLGWATHCLDLSQPGDLEVVDQVRRSIIRNRLGHESWWDDSYADDPPPEYRQHFDRIESYVERHSYMRYNRSAFTIVPWLASCVELAGSTVVEVGCGTGSTTAVLARNCRHVFGYDIDAQVLATADVRLKAMNIENVSLSCHTPSEIQDAIMRRHSESSIDIVVLYAVVEHQTLDERIEALANAWRLVRPHGCLVVVEAPNRLTYHDWHSSTLPFFHLLPRELQVRYASRSPRPEFAETVSRCLASRGSDAAEELLIRWGQSVSYHDFELVFGDLDDLIAADGFHPMLERDKPAREKKGEAALARFLEDEQLAIPAAFTRACIDVVFRKPAGGDET